MRDWPKTLRPASVRGVPFLSETEEFSNGGRNTVTHEFVRSEDVSSEDMGRKGQRFKHKGYVCSDLADAECQAVIAACCAPGPMTLVMPSLGVRQVLCTDVSASVSKDRLGYVEISMEFVEAGNGGGFPSIALGDRLAIAAISALSTVVAQTVQRFGSR